MGRFGIAIAPARKISSESTPAKIGRSMKKREMLIFEFSFQRTRGQTTFSDRAMTSLRHLKKWSDPGFVFSGGLGHHDGFGGDEGAGAHALQAVHDDLLVGL